MKKIKYIILIVVLSIIFCASGYASAAPLIVTTLQVEEGNVMSDTEVSKVLLKGTFANKGLYAQNIIIEVRDIKTDKLRLTIKPKTNEGYLPKILLSSFNQSSIKQIFLGMDSGGSGGFGYFYLFDVKDGKQSTVFDYEKYNKTNQYSGAYKDNYKVEIVNNKDKTAYLIDISMRPKDYLDMLYDVSGKLLQPTEADISGVNVVFPYFNTTVGHFDILVMQRITGIYGADSLGYINNQLSLEDGIFKSYFITLGIFGNKMPLK